MVDNNKSDNMVVRMKSLSTEIKQLAVANRIPIVVLCSATPDNPKAAQSPPVVEQVAWSKQFAYDANLAFAVHKYDQGAPTGEAYVEVVGRKNRIGDLFAVILEWDMDRGIINERFDLPTSLAP